MAMSKEQMLSILSTMDEGNLQSALSAVGVDLGQDNDMDFGDESAEGLESWNAKDVQADSPNKPSLVDMEKFIKQPQMDRAAQYGAQPNVEGLEQFMPSQDDGLKSGY